ncbi:hypothetical protein VTK73DRAFT_4460 [Phialemonium thermophilum]|uniref:Mitochondrial intermediate peptidase n=1 Tax=Phialemonium thermophilum TaxID=223376 RepID=A0ABR3WTA3_9PEZI
MYATYTLIILLLKSTDMLQSVPPRPWICARCLGRRASVVLQRRSFQQQAREALDVADANPVYHSQVGERFDDSLLRQIFDSPSVWNAFGKASGRPHVGLFRNAFLTGPEGFHAFARASLRRSQKIVEKVLQASTVEEYRCIVRDLDRLSDILCRHLDMTEFLRAHHPDPRVQQAAEESWYAVYQYMNELNTTTELNDQLGRALGNKEVTATWSEEDMTVAQILKLDFTKSAVDLPQASRDRFVQVSQRITEVGNAFTDSMAPEQRQLVLPSSKFQGMDPVLARRLTRRGYLYLPTLSAEAAVALRSVHDPETRKAIYYASRTASKHSVKLLEEMVRLRAELARLSGFDSYATMTLRDRMMARNPESVNQFLLALTKKNAPVVQQEMVDLLAEKKRRGGSAHLLEPWDREYYAEAIRRSMKMTPNKDDFLSAYFSLGTVMQGLSRIFSRLYGVRFVPTETLPGETWHPDVRRLDVVSDTDGHVAVLYCDLFYRESKPPNPAHFTVRCSRELSPEEVAEAAEDFAFAEAPHSPTFSSHEEAANDGMSLSKQSGALKQLPTIALVCDFPQTATSSSRPALLNFFQMETLFHEMGHAVHSVLARTSRQVVSGTRCATDLAELPSTLMEYFAADPATLALFARHHETDEPLRYDLVAERLRLSKRFEGSDTEHQIVLAMLDQELHSPHAPERNFDSTAMYHELQRRYCSTPPDPPGTRWQGFFGHLFSYGSTYYSYLFDRVLAERVWRVAFNAGAQGGALDRANGEHVKESLLRWGGSRDPWRCLADTLRDDRVADGGERAMAIVGSWGASSVFKE